MGRERFDSAGFDSPLRQGTGTLEWADKNYNICIGCQSGCLYCFAKRGRCRFREDLRVPGAWERQALNPRSKLGSNVGAAGVIMFPSTHDIVPDFLEESLITLKNLLLNNQVLIVSKPHLAVIRRLCRELDPLRNKILFRFTIGSLKPELCRFWEPHAPPPSERLRSLQHAFHQGFSTSISVEPMLDDVAGTCALVKRVEPFVTDTIWIGKMQCIPEKLNAHVDGFLERKAHLKNQQRDSEILRLVEQLDRHPRIRWKDSVRRVITKHAANGKPI